MSEPNNESKPTVKILRFHEDKPVMNETKYFVVWVTPAQYRQPAARSYLGFPWGPQWVVNKEKDAQRVDANTGRQIIARLEDEWRTKHSIPLGSYYELEQCKDESESKPVESKQEIKAPMKYAVKRYQSKGWHYHYQFLNNSGKFGLSDVKIFNDKDEAQKVANNVVSENGGVVHEISDMIKFEASLIEKKKNTYWVTWCFDSIMTSSVFAKSTKRYLRNTDRDLADKGEQDRWVNEKYKWSDALMCTNAEATRAIDALKSEGKFLDSTCFKVEPYVDEPAASDEDEEDDNIDDDIDERKKANDEAVKAALIASLDVAKDKDFRKDDDDKVRADLLPATALFEVAGVLTIGAAKYGPDNWRKVDDVSRYKAAMMRHVLAYLSGEASDAETGLSHLAHAVCNAMFLMELSNTEPS